ncbi:hypothetical protein ACFO0N_06165 [Halobium salinum]|uniref:Glycerophosphoryl diester phosphodiesterase membrane domain-containing protein n=1 Tax=Halobium salinum TaxID=1364940 RepID=A0ABD5PA13_9EURY|nr:hypothetical protein [Halobium salinum]
MSWYAFDAVDDALSATRRFLLPFSFGRWARVALVVLFLGSGVGGFTFPGFPGGTGTGPVPTEPTEPTPTEPVPTDPGPELDPGTLELLLWVGLALLAVLVAVGLVWTVVAPVMRFVLVDMLRTDEVRVRRWFRTRFWKGMRLLGFQLGVGLLVSLPLFVLGALFLLLDMGTGVGLAGLLVLALVAVPVLLVVGFFLGFTTQFVVPVMVAADVGVVAGWRRFWPTLRGHPWQFLVYVLVRWVLTLGLSIGVAIVVGLLGAIVVVSSLIAGFLVAGAFGGVEAALASTTAVVLLALVALVGFAVLFVLTLAVAVPVRSFLTSYELSVLGRAEPRFALLPETGDEDSDSDGDPGTGNGGDGPRAVGGGTPAVTRRTGFGEY